MAASRPPISGVTVLTAATDRQRLGVDETTSIRRKLIAKMLFNGLQQSLHAGSRQAPRHRRIGGQARALTATTPVRRHGRPLPGPVVQNGPQMYEHNLRIGVRAACSRWMLLAHNPHHTVDFLPQFAFHDVLLIRVRSEPVIAWEANPFSTNTFRRLVQIVLYFMGIMAWAGLARVPERWVTLVSG